MTTEDDILIVSVAVPQNTKICY